jgi:hypothetical protein
MDYSLLIGVKRERFEIHTVHDPMDHEAAAAAAEEKQQLDYSDASMPEDAASLLRQSSIGALARESLAVANLERRRSMTAGGPGGHSMSPIDDRGSMASIVQGGPGMGRGTLGGGGGPNKSIAPLTVGLSNEGNSQSQQPGREWRIFSQDNYAELARDPDGGLRARFVEGPGTYYIGMIDVLQEWNWKKRIESLFKTWIRLDDPDGISAVEPDFYQERFWKRCVLDTFDGLQNMEDEETGLTAGGGYMSHSVSQSPFTDFTNVTRPSGASNAGTISDSIGGTSNATYGENEPQKMAYVSGNR